jgi:hypothetical protein
MNVGGKVSGKATAEPAVGHDLSLHQTKSSQFIVPYQRNCFTSVPPAAAGSIRR